MGNRIIRETTPEDTAEVLALYPQAFPEEDLRPLVSALLAEGPRVLSLAAYEGGRLAGHVLFALCGTTGPDHSGAILGPLGVMPGSQRQGLGSALVWDGLERLRGMGIRQVFVLGDTAYYGRFGFRPERQVLPPYPLPEAWAEAWQSVLLGAGKGLAAGRLSLPGPWMDAALWGV